MLGQLRARGMALGEGLSKCWRIVSKVIIVLSRHITREGISKKLEIIKLRKRNLNKLTYNEMPLGSGPAARQARQCVRPMAEKWRYVYSGIEA